MQTFCQAFLLCPYVNSHTTDPGMGLGFRFLLLTSSLPLLLFVKQVPMPLRVDICDWHLLTFARHDRIMEAAVRMRYIEYALPGTQAPLVYTCTPLTYAHLTPLK
jgi:hypothetical protein